VVASSADLGAVPQVTQPRTQVFHDGFDGPSTFTTTRESAASGTLTTALVSGSFRMQVEGVGESYTAWVSTAVRRGGQTWEVSTTQGSSQGACGVYVTDGSSQLTATVDDSGAGTLAWFSQSGNTHNEPFAVPPELTGELAMIDDHGVIAVLVAGRRVATVVDPSLGPPTAVGFASHGDRASCDYDDIAVTTAP
jgi:hypothetical protein